MSSSTAKSDEEIDDEEEYPRDSFDRFGDDMVDLLVNRPPITVNDLIEWEDTSRQFQLVGNQYAHRIQRIELTETRIIQPLLLHRECRHLIGPQCLTMADKFRRHVMERFPQIRYIDLKYIPINQTMTDIMNIIVDDWGQLWPNLERIDGLVFGDSVQPLVAILQPVQSMFRQLDVSRTPSPKPWLRQFRQLEQLVVRNIEDLFDNNQQMVVEKPLQGLCCRLILSVDWFQLFVDQTPGLRRLIVYSLANAVPVGPLLEDVNDTLVQIGRLHCLQELAILTPTLYDQSIGQPLADIAHQCRQLIRFSIRFGYTDNNLQAFVDTVEAIKRMNQLKQLAVETIDGQTLNDQSVRLAEQQLTAGQRLGLQVTADCWPELRQLKLRGKMLALLANQQFFGEIHQTLPRLESLDCQCCMTVVIADGLLVWQSLAQLSRLDRVVIRGPVLDNLTKDQIRQQLAINEQRWQRRSKLHSIWIEIIQNQRLVTIKFNPLKE